jgi:hypothetical protein
MAQQLVRARVLSAVPDIEAFVFDPNASVPGGPRGSGVSSWYPRSPLSSRPSSPRLVLALRRAVSAARARLEQSQEALLRPASWKRWAG